MGCGGSKPPSPKPAPYTPPVHPALPHITGLTREASAAVQQDVPKAINGQPFTLIWHQVKPGREHGKFKVAPADVPKLAKAAQSIHIRTAGRPSDSVTLKPGVTWPLERLRKGRCFDSTLEGTGVAAA